MRLAFCCICLAFSLLSGSAHADVRCNVGPGGAIICVEGGISGDTVGIWDRDPTGAYRDRYSGDVVRPEAGGWTYSPGSRGDEWTPYESPQRRPQIDMGR